MNERGNVLIGVLIFIIIILVVIGGICLGITSSDNEEAKEVLSQIISKKVSIEDFKKALEENNLTINNQNKKAAELLGALEGYGYEINGEIIEIYKFDEKNKNELTKSNIEKAKTKGVVTMPSFNNMEFKAIYNKGLVLVNYEEHPDEEKIVKIFKEL